MKIFGRRPDIAPPPPVVKPAPAPVRPTREASAIAELDDLAPLPEAEKVHRITQSVSHSVIAIQLRERTLHAIDPTAVADMSFEALRRQLEQIIHEIANEERYEFSRREQTMLADELAADMVGNGPLEPLLRDDEITDIMVNGPDLIYVERRGKLELTNVRFRDNEHIAQTAQKIVSRIGRRIDESSPMCDARLQDGSRVNVLFPPLAVDSPCISIRKFSRRRLSLPLMVENGTMSAGVARLLGIAARARLNVIISGGTGAGKTMLLNAMSRMIDHGERIITIEDAAELQLQQRHVIRTETRPPNLEGTGQITQRELLWNALRMRPDRIILGEVRGIEAFDMLQAMNTGHDGSMCTLHANTARDALTRIENMVQMGHSGLPVRSIRQQIVGALDLIIQIERMHDGQRRVTQVTEVCNMEGDIITLNDCAVLEFDHEDENGRIVSHYKGSLARPLFLPRLEYHGLGRAWAAALAEI